MTKKRFYFSRFLFTIICIAAFIKTEKEMQKLVYSFLGKKEKASFQEMKKFDIRKKDFFKSDIEKIELISEEKEENIEEIEELKEEKNENSIIEKNISNKKIFYIQIGIFFKEASAIKVQKKLDDISSFIEEDNMGDKKVYKLISEDVEGIENADKLIEKIHKKLKNNERLIKRLRSNSNGESSKH